MKKILGHIFSSIFTIAGLTIREALRKRIIFIILLISSFFLLMNFFCESVTMQANGEEVKDSAIGPIFHLCHCHCLESCNLSPGYLFSFSR